MCVEASNAAIHLCLSMSGPRSRVLKLFFGPERPFVDFPKTEELGYSYTMEEFLSLS